MPVAGCRRCGLGLHEFLLDIDWRCRWRHRRRITIAVTTISITPISIAPISSSRVTIPISVTGRIVGRSCPGAEAVAQHTHAKCKSITAAPAAMPMMMVPMVMMTMVAVTVVTMTTVAVTMMAVAPTRPG